MAMKNKILLFCFVVLTSTAHAGTLTCTGRGSYRLGIFNWTTFGSCTPSASYSVGGETFPGSASPWENAAATLCGQPVVTVDQVLVGSGTGGHAYFDKDNGTVRIQGIRIPSLTASQPTFTVTKGAIVALSELGLSVDAATATVNNNIIASTRILTTNSPVSAPTVAPTVPAALGTFEDVVVGTDVSQIAFDYVAFCNSAATPTTTTTTTTTSTTTTTL